MGFVWPGDLSVVEGEDAEPDGSDFAGKKRLALRVRGVTLVIPNERFARFVARSRGVSCDTDLGLRVGVQTAFGHVLVPANQKGGKDVQGTMSELNCIRTPTFCGDTSTLSFPTNTIRKYWVC